MTQVTKLVGQEEKREKGAIDSELYFRQAKTCKKEKTTHYR